MPEKYPCFFLFQKSHKMGYPGAIAVVKEIIKHFPEKNCRILDVGAGTGLGAQEVSGLSWCRRHEMETLSALLALFEVNPPVTGVSSYQGPKNGILIFFAVSRKELWKKQSSCG